MAVAAGDVGGQALALGLVHEVAMDVVPVVFGSSSRSCGAVTTCVQAPAEPGRERGCFRRQ